MTTGTEPGTGLRRAISRQLRRSDAWVTFRRLQEEGFRAAYHRWRAWAKVLALPPVVSDKPTASSKVEVHLVCRQRDYLTALWALKSFYASARVGYPLVVHLNGPFSRTAASHLRQHLPSAYLVPQRYANTAATDWLVRNNCPHLLKLRTGNGFMLKLVDVALFGTSTNVLLLDSDVLFFRSPVELVDAAEDHERGWMFQRDVASTYNMSSVEAERVAGVCLAPQINTGIAVLPRARIDLRRCEQYVAEAAIDGSLGWIEQTLYALLASVDGQISYLPPTYLVSLAPRSNIDALIARHYAGPSRPFFTEEGIPYLLNLKR